MDCFACGKPILRRYFTQEFQGESVMLCPLCNKQWDKIKPLLLEKHEEDKEVEDDNTEREDSGLSE